MNETWWVNQEELDRDQLAVIVEPPETELLIIGPPGSGKTNLLLLRANYVRNVGPRIVFLIFTRTLTEFLRSGNVGRADQIQPGQIMTFMSWANQIVREHGEVIADATDFKTRRENALSALEAVIDSRRLAARYDYIFVDEVQDLQERELRIIRRMALHVNFAGDSRQRIYTNQDGLRVAEQLAAKTITLERHYRIGEKICAYADRILPPPVGVPGLLSGCNYPEEARESSVRTIACDSDEACFATCLRSIKEQIRYISDEPIGVLAPDRKLRDAFWNALLEDADLVDISLLQSESSYQPFGPNDRIQVMTIHSSKGLEFRAVHILGAHQFRSDKREVPFTAVTRAKSEVALYHAGPLESFLMPPEGRLPSDLGRLF